MVVKEFQSALIQLYQWRELLILQTKINVGTRYRRSYLGVLWTLLNPVLASAVLWVVFVQVFNPFLDGDQQYAPYVLSGVLLITFFIQGTNFSAEAISSAIGVVKKINVPPYLFTLAATLGIALNFLMANIVLIALSILVGNGVNLKLPLLLLVALFMTLLTAGLGFALSVLYLRYEDTRNLVAVTMQLIAYLTPTFYPIDILSEKLQLLIHLNPLHSFLEIYRNVVIGSQKASLNDWLYMSSISVFVFIFGIVLLQKNWPRTVALL